MNKQWKGIANFYDKECELDKKVKTQQRQN